MSRPASPSTRSTADARNAGAPLFAFLLMLSVLPSALASEPAGSFTERARIVAMGITIGAAEAPREALAVLPIWALAPCGVDAMITRASTPDAVRPPEGWWTYAQSGPAPPRA